MPKRIDLNQKVIVELFRKLGASVLVMSDLGKGAPDLVVGFKGKTYLIEVKNGNKPISQQKLTKAEEEFKNTWRGHYEVINSIRQVENFLRRVSSSEILC